MSVDIATLGMKIDSSEVPAANERLDQLAAKGARAEKATEALTSATSGLKGAQASMGAAMNGSTSAMAGFASNAGNAEAKARGAAGATGEMASRVSALKASVDPLGAALDRANAELAEARGLFAAGAIGAADLAQAEAMLAARTDNLTARRAASNAIIMGGARTAKLAAHEALGLSRQFADVGVSMAMGMNPLMILIQQGPQIADIMKTSGLSIGGVVKQLLIMVGILKEVETVNSAVAASQAGIAGAKGAVAAANGAVAVTAKAAATAETQLSFAFMGATGAAEANVAATGAAAAGNTALGASATGMVTKLSRFGIVGLAIIAVLALVTGAFAIFAHETNKNVGDVTKTMGLTEKQLERLKDKGTETTITLGDSFKGFFMTVGQMFGEAFGPEIAWLKQAFSDVYEFLKNSTLTSIKLIIGGFIGAYRAIGAVWSGLPSMFSEWAVAAANGVIAIVEMMVNKVIQKINSISNMVNAAAKFVGFEAPFGDIDNVSVGRIANPNAGATGRTAQAAGAAFSSGMAEGGAMVDRFGERWRKNSLKAAQDRIREAAGKPGDPKKDSGGKGGKSEAEREYEQAIKSAQDYIKSLKEETAEIGKNRIETRMLQAERAAAAVEQAGQKRGTDAAIAQSRELAAQIRDEAKAWKSKMIAQAEADMRRDLQDQLSDMKFENSLLGMNAEQRAVANAQREIEIKLRQAQRDGTPIDIANIKAETDAILDQARARGKVEDAATKAREAADHMHHLSDSVRDAIDSFSELFGTAGEGFAMLVNAVLTYRDTQVEAEARIAEAKAQYGADSVEAQRTEREASAELSRARIQQYGAMLTAAKHFFKEGSTGWKIMEAAEKAYRIIQFAMAIKAMLFDKAQTASSIANSGARAAADGVAAFAKTLASLPFPFNLVAGAAVLAALIAVGVKIAGGGKGKAPSASASATAAADAYTGPRDEYGAPTSSYSVLRPGQTTVAGANDNRISPNAANYNGAAVGNNITFGDTVLHVGNVDSDDRFEQIAELLRQNKKDTVEEARSAVAADLAAKATRQRIGGR